MKKQILSLALAAVTLAVGPVIFSPGASAQSSISGAIAGTVTDASGAVIPGAQVTARNTADGSTQTTTANSAGNYSFNLLKPGPYSLKVVAPGFGTTELSITVSTSATASADVKLNVGQSETVVNVTGSDIPLLHTEDAQISTTYSLEQVQSLPNPGNDITFVAQTAPGSVMNTQGGYGNFSSFGLPATSNSFTVNGGYENDPFLNISNSGASNLLLGSNDVATVTVVSPAYDASFGGLAGAQVNEISRSGANTVHGNLSYFWNGSVMNANDWFNNHSGTKKPRSNANQWAAAIGGPIVHDKAFWFINTEGLRVIIPVRSTIYAPSAKWQSIITGAPFSDISSAACQASSFVSQNASSEADCYAPYGNLAANGLQSEIPLYNTIFNYFNHANGASAATVDPTDDRFVSFNSQGSNFAQEWIITARTDFNISDKDKLNIHYEQDKGVQPTFTSTINPLFNASSPQPSYQGQLNYTRTITPTIVNQLLVTGSYNRAIFTNTSEAQATASLPQVFIPLDGDWGGNSQYVGGEDYAFPQGRNVTGYQVADDLSIVKGNNTIKMGWAMRRDDVTDYTPSEHQVGENEIFDNGSFAGGYTDQWAVRFPSRLTQPVALYTMGAYLEDAYKPVPNLTLTLGLRAEHNSNLTCRTNCFSNYATDFASLPAATTAPYATLFSSNRHRAFLHPQQIGLDPRFGFAWQPNGVSGKTTVRGGFGIFTDSFPAQIASNLLANPPGVVRFTIQGKAFNNPYTADPSRSDSAQAIAVDSDKAFATAYSQNGSYSSISAATGHRFARPAFVGTAPTVKLPTTEEWSLALERQVDRSTAVSLTYVGNHSYHGPISNPNVNAWGKIAGLPTSRPNPSLGTSNYYYSANQSNYNGLTASVVRRSSWLTLGANYAYSHALDLVSNGGFDAFGLNPEGQEDPYNLSLNYGNADYDIRHYVSGSYLITPPHFHGPMGIAAGWEISGTVFHSSGLPFTVIDSATVPNNYGGTLYAQQIGGNSFNHSCGGSSHAADGTPCVFASHFASATGFGQQHRNTLTGPAYTDTDMAILKTFPLGYRNAQLKAGAQFFNLLNHPNFAQPVADVAAGSQFGTIQGTVSTPTSILGSFLGGDASPRLIQLKATITF